MKTKINEKDCGKWNISRFHLLVNELTKIMALGSLFKIAAIKDSNFKDSFHKNKISGQAILV